jgi:hypothetical protein
VQYEVLYTWFRITGIPIAIPRYRENTRLVLHRGIGIFHDDLLGYNIWKSGADYVLAYANSVMRKAKLFSTNGRNLCDYLIFVRYTFAYYGTVNNCMLDDDDMNKTVWFDIVNLSIVPKGNVPIEDHGDWV